jgi:hypothetical protein
MLILVNEFLIIGRGIVKRWYRWWMEGGWVVALAPTVITNKGATVHPRDWMELMRGSYLRVLRAMESGKKRSLQKVNSIN